MHKPYVAIIGDIKQSKALKDRGAVQTRMQEVMATVNSLYREEIASSFTITLGDEFQGLLHRGDRALHILLDIENRLQPLSLRFGLGLGEITTAINPELSIGADGPAYYNAREAITALKADEGRKGTAPAFARIAFQQENGQGAEALNTTLVLMTAIQQDWTERQRQTVMTMLLRSLKQEALASELGVTQSTVQKSLAAGHYYAFKQGADLIASALKEMGESHV